MKSLAVIAFAAVAVVAQAPVARIEGLPTSVPFAARFTFSVVLEGKDTGIYAPPRSDDFLPLVVDTVVEVVASGKRRVRVDASAVTSGSVTLRGVAWRASTSDGPAAVIAPPASLGVVSSLAPDARPEPELPDAGARRASGGRWWWVLLVVPIGVLWWRRRSSDERRRWTSLRRAVETGATDPRDVLTVARATVAVRCGVVLDAAPASEWSARLGTGAPEAVVAALVAFGGLRERADYAGVACRDSEKDAALVLAEVLIAWAESGSR